MRTKKIFRVGISGSYGGLNLGDEAILQNIIAQLRRSLRVEISVFSRDAEDTRSRHNVERVVQVREFTRAEVIKEIERLDLFVLGGGGILYDAEAQIYLREVELAHEMGVPVMTYAIGAGPLSNPGIQKLVRDTLSRASLLTVRERSDRKTLEDVGIHEEITVTADPAFLLKPEPFPDLKTEHMETGRTMIAISVREPGIAAPDIDERFYHGLLANAADFMIDRFDADVVFVPMERRMLDMQQSHAIMAQMLYPQRAHVLKGEYTPGQVLSLMGHCDFAVGMRLHFLIFAALQGVPFVALPYSTKVSGLLDTMEMEMPPMKLVSTGRLIAHIDRSWDRRNSLKRKIREALPELKRRALQTNRLTVKLLRSLGVSEESAPGSQ